MMAHPMQHYGERKPKLPPKITLYQIDPNLHPDDPMLGLVKQWIGTVLVPVEPCEEHDRIDPHHTQGHTPGDPADHRDCPMWTNCTTLHQCPGAGVGEETNDE